MSERIISLNVGRPAPLPYRGRTVVTGIRKRPVEGRLWLSATGLEGDEQADLKAHGGPDKAVCVYPSEHYPVWAAWLGLEVGAASFGENFTTCGWLEDGAHIGDIYRVGGAVVQITQPRQPCYKLAARHGVGDLAALVAHSGRTGFYLRVIEEGAVGAGDTVDLLESSPEAVSLSEANRVMHLDRGDMEAIERLLGVGALSASWRATLERRLADDAAGELGE